MHSLKVEILVPKHYNNNNKVEVRKHRLTSQDLTAKFKGCTLDESPLLGQWVDPVTKKKYVDQNFAFWVICDDNKKNLEFFKLFKQKLKARYKQKDILMYSVQINSI